MKKFFFTLLIVTSISAAAQKKYSNILNSTNIAEVENFLKEAHPDDSRRMILKHKIVSLKNDKWMKNGKSNYVATKSFAKPSIKTGGIIQNRPANFENPTLDEREEFQKLIAENAVTHQQKTVTLLNQLFDNDEANDKAILLIKNAGDCNIIVRIQGAENYSLAVPAGGENFLTVKKGDYQLSGSMCEAKYYAAKSIAMNMLVTLTKNSATAFSDKLSVRSFGVSN